MAATRDRRELGGSDEWRRELYEASPEREGELFSTISGLENDPLYTAEDVAVDHDRDLGYPGVFPFTRGVYPSMYRGRLWTMRLFAGFGTAEATTPTTSARSARSAARALRSTRSPTRRPSSRASRWARCRPR